MDIVTAGIFNYGLRIIEYPSLKTVILKGITDIMSLSACDAVLIVLYRTELMRLK